MKFYGFKIHFDAIIFLLLISKSEALYFAFVVANVSWVCGSCRCGVGVLTPQC